MEKNIWKNLNFTSKNDVSAYNLLVEQSKELTIATAGTLRMEVEALDAVYEEGTLNIVALYVLYVVAPKLGNFRRKILTVIEGKSKNSERFPVDIYCHIDDKQYQNINKEDFLDNVAVILESPIVRDSIEYLFNQSNDFLNKPLSEDDLKSIFNKKENKD